LAWAGNAVGLAVMTGGLIGAATLATLAFRTLRTRVRVMPMIQITPAPKELPRAAA
jgi:hypothetical protein